MHFEPEMRLSTHLQVKIEVYLVAHIGSHPEKPRSLPANRKGSVEAAPRPYASQ